MSLDELLFKIRAEASEGDDLTPEATLKAVMEALRTKSFEPAVNAKARNEVVSVVSFCLPGVGKVKVKLLSHRREDRQADLPPLPPGWWDEPESRSDQATILQRLVLRRVTMATLYAPYRLVLEDRIRMEDPEAYATKGIDLATLRRRIARVWVLVRAEFRARRRISRTPISQLTHEHARPLPLRDLLSRG
jgi:hypothetical protein